MTCIKFSLKEDILAMTSAETKLNFILLQTKPSLAKLKVK